MVHRVTCRNKNKRTPICPSTSASAISGPQIGRFVVVRRLRASLVRLSLWRLAIARTADGTTNFSHPARARIGATTGGDEGAPYQRRPRLADLQKNCSN